MATFGIEGIRYFENFRNSGAGNADDLTYVFNICNGLDNKLRESGHTRTFYWANDSCWEIDLRDASSGGGGIDDQWADNVDLFFLLTHGNHDGNDAMLAYDIRINEWIGHSSTWKLGNNTQLEWLLIYGCKTVNLNNPLGHWDRFQRLHELCGAYDDMWDSPSTDEVGEDIGDNLTDGDTVADAWIDGVSDWLLDNHPIVIAAERRDTYNNGNFVWSETTLNNDHFWGHGNTVSDIYPTDKYWLSWMWAEG
jgi:hypothetical protein